MHPFSITKRKETYTLTVSVPLFGPGICWVSMIILFCHIIQTPFLYIFSKNHLILHNFAVENKMLSFTTFLLLFNFKYSNNFSLMYCFVFKFLSFKKYRDHPDVIKRRFLSVAFNAVVVPPLLLLFSETSQSAEVWAFPWIRFKILGLVITYYCSNQVLRN